VAIYYSRQVSALNAELWAILKAFHMIEIYDIQNVTIETDCLNAVTLLHGIDSDPPWQNLTLVRACRRMKQIHPQVLISHVRRQANQVAHSIAAHGRSGGFQVEGPYDASTLSSATLDLIRFERSV